jgi:hypothetical protein
MTLLKTITKSTALSAIIFWSIIFTDVFEVEMLAFIFLSLIPIFLCNAIVIASTIAPFFWINTDKRNTRHVFYSFFPYYALVSFLICGYGIIKWPDALSFFTAAFFSSLQSWVWILKTYENATIKPQNSI